MAVVDTQAEIIHDMGTEGLQAELSGQEYGNGTLEVDECHPEAGNGPLNVELNSRNWVSFWMLGLLNNFAYVVVLCGAAALADSFGEDKLAGVVPWANVAMGMVARMLNMSLLDKSAFSRILAAAIVFFAAYILLFASVYCSFLVAILAIVLIGGACSLGESVLLGYMKGFPAQVVGGFSSGTGMAGVAGALYYMALWLLLHEHLGWDCQSSLCTIFFLMTPLPILFVAIFRWGPKQAWPGRGGGKYNTIFNAEAETMPSDEANALLGASAAEPASTKTGSAGRICLIAWQVSGVSLNLMAVYFFEYVVSVGFAIRSPSAAKNGDWWCRNGYQVLQVTYQSGVLASRSSLGLVRVRRLWIISLLQAVNFAGWCANAQLHFLESWQQVVWMIWVGLMGGMMYVNTFANLIDDTALHENDRELAINVVSVSMNAGVAASAFFQLWADHAFLNSRSCAAAMACSPPTNSTLFSSRAHTNPPF